MKLNALILLLAVSLSAQVNLGGRIVPKESCVVFIFIGHSNMSGRCPDRDTVTHPKLWNYSLDQLRPVGWRPAREAMYADRTINADLYGGPGMPFLKQIQVRYPNHYFGLFENAEGRGTAAAYLNNQDVNGHKLYEEIVNPLKDTSIIKGKVTFGGIVVMLGLVEAYINATSEIQNFAVNMKNLVQKMRFDLNERNLPLLMSQYEMCATGSFAPHLPNPQAIIRQIDSLGKILPYTAVIPTDSIEINPHNNDDHHYSQKGYETFTKRCIDTLAARGWDVSWGGTEIERSRNLPPKAGLMNVRPNPAGRGMTIAIGRPGNAALSAIRILDLNGRTVRALVPERHATEILWEGRDDRGRLLSPGCYIVAASLSGQKIFKKKLVLMP